MTTNDATTSGLTLVQIDALAQVRRAIMVTFIMADPDRLANLLAAFAA